MTISHDNPADSVRLLVIAGGRKCGSTSLEHGLGALDSVRATQLRSVSGSAFMRDLGLAGTNFQEGKVDHQEWWQQGDRLAEFHSSLKGSSNEITLIREPDLLQWQPHHDRFSTLAPDARFIVLLRDPLKRLWSHYWDEVQKGRELLSFEQAIRLEDERGLESDWAKFHLGYLRHSCYGTLVESLNSSFGSKRVHVVVLEDLVGNSSAASRLFDFCGIRGADAATFSLPHSNRGGAKVPRVGGLAGPMPNWLERFIQSPRSLPPMVRGKSRLSNALQTIAVRPAKLSDMPMATRRELELRLRPEVEHLHELLGRGVDAWSA